ncbi:transposase [Bacteroidales bacterium]|nr:transposase [Bacteroidales bacterium]
MKTKRFLVEADNKELSICQQCILLSISRSGFYYSSKNWVTEERQVLLDSIDEIYTDQPYLGTRRMVQELLKKGVVAGRKIVRKCYQILNIEAIYPKPSLTISNKDHFKYPYLLRGLKIDRANQVWSTDITYIRMEKGFMYLCAVIDWYSRRVLSWGLSNTHDSDFTTSVLEKAIHSFGTPEIFNTDQGSEFTASTFIDVLKANNISISMDGKGRALDNIFIERFWRTIKYEYVYVDHPETGKELFDGLSAYIEKYNMKRGHQSLGYKTPDKVYRQAA